MDFQYDQDMPLVSVNCVLIRTFKVIMELVFIISIGSVFMEKN